MRISAASASVALATALAACSPQPNTVPTPAVTAGPAPVAQPVVTASGPGAIDGVYRAPPGGATGNAACGTTRFGYPIRVANGMASMQTVSQGRLEGPVGQDGSIDIQNGRATLHGTLSGGQFTGTYNVGRCGFVLNYHK